MALVSLNLKPSEKQLRDFADITLCMCNIIGLVLFWIERIPVSGLEYFCAGGVIVFVLSRISAVFIKPLYLGLIIITFPIGWVVSHIVMGIFYFVIVTSVAFVFRLMKRDILLLKRKANIKTYWMPFRKSRPVRDYFNQF